MSIQQQVSRAIRILRGNRDVSARASHLVVQQDQLMTYESVLVGQAEMEKFSKSTFSERKIMSTKTSIKRIAAVAAVALTLGGFSAVSAHADAPIVDTLAASSTTVAATSNVASKVAVTQAFLSQGTNGAAAVTAALISAPAGNVALPTFDTATVTGYTDVAATGRNATATTGTSSTMVTSQSVTTTYTAATYNLSFTPVKSGTYVVKLVPTTGTISGTTYTAGTTATATASPTRMAAPGKWTIW